MYKLGETYINISKLEYISNIISDYKNDENYFRYQINGYVHNSKKYRCDEIYKIKILREKLIKQWEIELCYQDQLKNC